MEELRSGNTKKAEPLEKGSRRYFYPVADGQVGEVESALVPDDVSLQINLCAGLSIMSSIFVAALACVDGTDVFAAILDFDEYKSLLVASHG